MNYYERHIGDYLRDTAHLSLLHHGIYARLLDVYYTREHGFDKCEAHRLIGARSKEERNACDEVLTEFFLCAGNLWTQTRCDKEIARYRDKQEKAKRSAEARWSHSEGNAKAMRTHSEGNALQAPDTIPKAMRTHCEGNALQTPDTIQKKENQARAVDPPAPSRALLDAEPAESNGHGPTPAGTVCRAMRNAGLAAVNPGDPRLLALIAQGATLAEFEGLAAEAAQKSKGFAWALKVIEARRAEAGAIALAPPPAPPDWRASRSAVIAKGCELGLGPFDETDTSTGRANSWDGYRRRVIEADEQRETA